MLMTSTSTHAQKNAPTYTTPPPPQKRKKGGKEERKKEGGKEYKNQMLSLNKRWMEIVLVKS